jgi:hypothetical protein
MAAALLLAGCSQPRMESSDPLAGVPDDFSVDLTLLSGTDGDRAHQSTSRLVVLADGSLHFDALAGRGPNTMPGWVRRLDREEMARLWDSAVRLGLTDTSKADPVADLRRARLPVDGGSVWLLAMTGNGDRWNYLRSYAEDVKPDAAIQSFVRDALSLAWAQDAASEHRTVEPMRWDYGGNPWLLWNDAVKARAVVPGAAVEKASGDGT